MEDITKEFLIKNGFREEDEDTFTYSNKEHTIEVLHLFVSNYNRFWKIIIFSSTRFIIGDILAQTTGQFNKVMEIYDIDLNNK